MGTSLLIVGSCSSLRIVRVRVFQKIVFLSYTRFDLSQSRRVILVLIIFITAIVSHPVKRVADVEEGVAYPAFGNALFLDDAHDQLSGPSLVSIVLEELVSPLDRILWGILVSSVQDNLELFA